MEQEKEHVFSERFEERQKMMIERVKEEERNSNHMRRYSKKWAAAAAVVLLVVGGSVTAAGRSGVFKVEDLVVQETKEEGVVNIAFGFPESNEWKGSKEWQEFFWEYWETDEYLDACGRIDENLSKGIKDDTFSKYPESYSIVNQKMADKLEEILKKYDLKLEGEAVTVDSYEKLLSQMKMESFIDAKPENIDMPFANIHEEGNWQGDFTLGGKGGICMGQISVSHKGVLDSLGLNLGDLSDYEEWNYVNENGDSLKLMTNPKTNKSYIFYEGAQDFVVINLRSELSKERLEKTADTFKFSKLSKAE